MYASELFTHMLINQFTHMLINLIIRKTNFKNRLKLMRIG